MEKQMTTFVELSRDQIESIIRAELEFLIDYERQSTDPDVALADALRLVYKQFTTIGEPDA
jgi:hypothetical protein